jgi:glycosyl transferase family 25
MRVLVINLDTQKARLSFQEAQLSLLELEMERIVAIDQTHPDVQSDDVYWDTWQRPLSAPERACLLSHQTAWRIVATACEPCLILEDDAVLSVHTPSILNALAAWTNEVDHVTLEVRNRKKLLANQSIYLNHHAQLKRLFLDRTGAAAYVLWPRGAQRLLKASSQSAGLADAVICAAPDLISYQIVPAAAIQLDQCHLHGISVQIQTSSSILASQKRLPQKHWRQQLRRIAAQLSMGWKQLKFCTVATRQQVFLSPQDFHLPKNEQAGR